MNRELEFWMPVIGYEGFYEVSDLGRVRSLNYNHTGQVRVLKPSKNGRGYLVVALFKDGVKKWFSVHRLVWEAFNCQIPSGYELDHINATPSDNRLSNLRVVTRKGNMANPITKQRQAEAGKKHSNDPEWRKNQAEAMKKLAQDPEWKKNHAETMRKVRNKSVLQIDKETGDVIQRFECARDACRELGVNFGNISSCCNGKLKTAGGYKWCYFMPPALLSYC